jgi:arsenate reductase (thioredoxin)
VISMGCDDPAVCDYPGRKVEDWGIEDPAGKPIAEVRRIRDVLRERVRELAARLERGAASPGTPRTAHGSPS